MSEHLDRGESFASEGWGTESNDYLTDHASDEAGYDDDEWFDSDEYWESFEDEEEDEPYDGYLYDD